MDGFIHRGGVVRSAPCSDRTRASTSPARRREGKKIRSIRAMAERDPGSGQEAYRERVHVLLLEGVAPIVAPRHGPPSRLGAPALAPPTTAIGDTEQRRRR
jgi:hypothetical protein